MRKEYHGLCYVQSVITSPSSSPTLIIVSVSVVVVVVIIIVDSTPCSEHSDYFHIFPESTSQVRSNYPSEGHILIPCSVHSVNFRVFPESQIQSTSELRAALYKYRLSSFGREKMKYLKLSQENGLYK